MIRNIYTVILAIMLAFAGVLLPCIVHAQQIGGDSDLHKTGLREMTPEQVDTFKKTHPRVIKVKLNKLGAERVKGQTKQKKVVGRLAVSSVATPSYVPDGQDLVTTIGAATETTLTVQTSAVGALKAQTLGAGTSEPVAALPSSVDNSTLKYFPPIRSQGSLGSCASFAEAYYTMTYMLAKARDWDAKAGGDQYRLSPRWTYNMDNFGTDGGSYGEDAFEIGVKHGVATWAEFPYNSTDYRSWPLTATIWRNAIDRRFDTIGYVNATNTDAGITQTKQMLVNGYILNFSTSINSWQYKAIANDPSTTADDAFVGKNCAYWVNGTNGSHRMTVVGYNDDIWVDINANGIVDAGEKGAFRIANSWGTGWQNAGFTWLAYDALKGVSAVSGAPSTGRNMAWRGAYVSWITARASYTPTFVVEFTINHAQRNQMAVMLGTSDYGQDVPSVTWHPFTPNYVGGAYAFDGTTTAVDGTFVLDASDIAPAVGVSKFFYLGLIDNNTDGKMATLRSCKLINVRDGNKVTVALDTPLVTDKSAYTYSIINNNTVISTPAENGFVKGPAFAVTGTASTDGQVKRYELWYAPVDNPQAMTLIASSTIPVQAGTLGHWNTSACQDGEYVLTLKNIDINNNEYKVTRHVIVDNVDDPPAFPARMYAYATIGQTLQHKIEAINGDDPATAWGKLTYALSNLPPGATFDPATQIINWTPTDALKGTYDVLVTVQDDQYTVQAKLLLGTLSIKESPVSVNPGSQESPVISGNNMAWQDNRSGSADIYTYDLLTQQETPMPFNGELHQNPVIDGSKMVWRNCCGSLYAYDLLTRQNALITTTAKPGFPASIGGDKVVWTDTRSSGGDVYMYDLATKQETRITANGLVQAEPQIHGEKIVWADTRNNNFDIYMYDLTAKQETQITSDSAKQYNPRIYGNKIIWQDNANGVEDIHVYDLTTKKETQVTTGGSNFRMYGDRIVWYEYLNSNYDIYMYDAAAKQKLRVTTDASQQYWPAIYANKIAWIKREQKDHYGSINNDIYMSELTFSPRLVSVSPSAVYANGVVTIDGSNFGDVQLASQVEFYPGVNATVTAWSDSKITCQAPAGVQDGPVQVVTAGGRSNSIQVTINNNPVVYGDVSGDSRVTMNDAVLVSRYGVGLITLTPTQLDRADVNGDSRATIIDAQMIMRHAVGLIAKFPVEL